MTAIEEFINLIPKAELHVHLEGTLEPELKLMIAERNDLQLPYASVEEMKAAYHFDDLASFLVGYYEGMSILLTEADFYDLASAYFSRVAAQHVVYVEMFFDPQAHTSRGVDFGTVIKGLHRAQTDAEATYGIRSQLIMCFIREMSVTSAFETLDLADPYKDWIVGVGLDSNEKGNPPEKFRAVFDDARSRGYKLTMHCDVDQENSLAHLWQCLDLIGVDRIDHGVNCLEDDRLVEEIRRRRLGLTVCPISNDYVTDGTKATAIKTMLDKELLVTVNSDDPAYFQGYMTENLLRVQREINLKSTEITRLVKNAFEVSWLEADARAAYLDQVDAFVAANSLSETIE